MLRTLSKEKSKKLSPFQRFLEAGRRAE